MANKKLKRLFEEMVEGTAYYFNPQQKSKYNNVEGKYELTLAIDKATAEKIKKAGGKVVRDKKVGTDADGNAIEVPYAVKPKSNYPIKVYDDAVQSLDNAIKAGLKIGNGSKVLVDLFVYEAPMNNGIGCNAVQVLELVEYTGGESGPVPFKAVGKGIADRYEADNNTTDADDLDDEIPF